MTMSDPIADMLTRIRNANTAKHDTVDVPASKMKIAIANILLDEGYIAKYDLVEDGHFQTIHITLKYGVDKNEKVISGLKRISKPGLRVYASTENIPKVLGGLGTAILSTNKGVVTDKEARKLGVGEAKDNAKVLESAIADMEKIAGQKAVVTRAKNSVANFKIREGMPIGCKVTLRGEKMYEFVDRLINLALPRVRDFRGVNPNAFDGRGNYALGIKEQLIFPEIEYDKIDKVRGMDVIFVTTAKTDEEARELLTQFNMPFAK